MSEPPKVSVCIASYNHARYLPDCLNSILSQTYQGFEIVVVDDGSQDGSHELLLDFQSSYPERIHYFWHPDHINQGYSKTTNLSIQKSRGKYIAWIGSDDIWNPDKLEQQVSILDNQPEIGLVYSYAEFIDGSGNRLRGTLGEDVTKDENPMGSMIISCHTPALTVIVRRDCLDQVGLFDELLEYSDWDLMMRIFSHWKAAYIDNPLGKYRVHGKNMSRGIDSQLNLHRIINVLQGIQKKSSQIGGALLDPRNQAIIDLQLAFHTFCDGNEDDAVMYLHRAFQKHHDLDSDIAFFDSWLNQWKPDYFTIRHKHFGFWTIANLPPDVNQEFRNQLIQLQLENAETRAFFIRRGIHQGQTQTSRIDPSNIFSDCPDVIPLPRLWKAQVLKEIYPALLFESHKAGDSKKMQYYWRKTVQLDPSWLKNRGVWLIGIKALMGNGVKSLH
jgi:glycosyltransferase involved in cell wall biosynthesis